MSDGGAPPYCPMCGYKVDLWKQPDIDCHRRCLDWGIYMKVYSTVECWKKACIRNGLRVSQHLLNI